MFQYHFVYLNCLLTRFAAIQKKSNLFCSMPHSDCEPRGALFFFQMKQIPLTQGKFALVDDEDYEFLMQWKWCTSSDGYAVRSVHVKKIDGKASCKTIKMHQVIMNTPAHLQVDHKFGDRLDNRKENLRLSTCLENSRNGGKRSNNKSGYKGVHWCKKAKKWIAKIRISPEIGRYFIGHFVCPIEAARAYNAAAIKYHGEFARLNEIP